MKKYKQQPTIKTFLEENPELSTKDYKEFFIGKFKGEKAKVKALFNSNKKTNHQVDLDMAKKITNPKYDWSYNDAYPSYTRSN